MLPPKVFQIEGKPLPGMDSLGVHFTIYLKMQIKLNTGKIDLITGNTSMRYKF